MRSFWKLTATAILSLPCIALTAAAADPVPFRIVIKEARRQPAPGLHSFAHAVYDGKWLLVGGRTNGFHRTSDPESKFPSRYANRYLYVVDPVKDASWKVAIPDSIGASLRTTNAAHYQDGDVLYVIGGYGSKDDDDRPESYQTFPNVTAIRVPEVIKAITSGHQEEVAKNIVTAEDERMRVTGGELLKLGDQFYLCFGQNYDGIYKGGYTGKYTGEIRRFSISLKGDKPSIGNYVAFGDPQGAGPNSQYHRRDLVVTESIRPDGTLGITAYGGVFTKTAGAWVNPILIDQYASGKTTVAVDTSFEQKMSQYDCANLVMCDPTTKTMYTTFFGGISLYYYDAQGQLTLSNLNNFTPFINSITTQARSSDGSTVEVPQPPANSLPKLLGSNATFIPLETLSRCPGSHEVLDYSKLPKTSQVHLGYLYGGILATAPQASEFNPTFANSTIYDVFLERP